MSEVSPQLIAYRLAEIDKKLDAILGQAETRDDRLQVVEKHIALLWGAYGIGLLGLGWVFVKVNQ